MKILKFIISLALLVPAQSWAAKVESCSSSPARLAPVRDERTNSLHYMLVPAIEGVSRYSDATCQWARAASATVQITNATVAAVGVACTFAPEPVLTKSAAVVMIVGGVGLVYADYVIKQVVDQCDDAQRDKKVKSQIESAVKEHLKGLGYKVEQ